MRLQVKNPMSQQPASDLHGKVVLVTGGSRGFGLLLARDFAREGCPIAICARDERELADGAQQLRLDGATVFTIQCDVSDQRAVERMIAEVTRDYGHIDVLVNNAGIIQVGPLGSQTVDDFREAMDVMFWGNLYPSLAVLPKMQARGDGSIVNITSIGGKISVPHLLPYGCAKFAAVGLSEGLRAEVARDGVRVTTVVPGLMRTGSQGNAYFKGNQEEEYPIFALGATLPFVSMDAEHAASQVVQATKRGEAEIVLGTPATIAVRIHGLLPGVVADLLGLVNRLLPASDGSTNRVKGRDVRGAADSTIFQTLISLGKSAAKRFNE